VREVVVATPVPVGEEQFLMRTLDPFPKRGGQLVLGAHGPPAHFDLFAAASISNHGSQAAMYDALIRRDPRDPRLPIIPDLAHRWEISSDGMTYTFFLREGVKFHDGAELTSADAKATYDRIIFPREGLVSIRQGIFPTVSEINTPDKYTVEFKLSEPRSTTAMLQAFSSEWNLIVRKATLDQYEGDLSKIDNYPGTGPFIYDSRDDDRWLLEANPDYWNPNVPYVDGIKHVWLKASTPENTAALLGGQLDWTMWLAPKDGRTIGDRPGLRGIRQHLLSMNGIGINNEHPPLDDARVRRAFMLVIDQQAIVKAIEDVKAFSFGEMFISGTPVSRPPEQLMEQKGFRHPTAEDIAEAQELLAEAGFPEGQGFRTLDLLTRESANQRIMSPAIQAMLKEHLNVNTEIRITDASQWLEEATQGNYDINPETFAFAYVPDPSFYLKDLLGMCGDELCATNTVRFRNDEFNALIEEISRELDQQKRIDISNQIRELLLREVPYIPVSSSEISYWGFWDHLKGMMPGTDFFANYELHKWDHVWLDR
jgi:peptide/nickel transport system substrate-binding protein